MKPRRLCDLSKSLLTGSLAFLTTNDFAFVLNPLAQIRLGLLDGKLRFIVPAAVILIGIAFIVYGVFDQEINAVLSKATALCRDCVGIG